MPRPEHEHAGVGCTEIDGQIGRKAEQAAQNMVAPRGRDGGRDRPPISDSKCRAEQLGMRGAPGDRASAAATV